MQWESKKLVSKAKEFGLDPDLVLAIVMTESGNDTCVVRYEPKWKYFFDTAKFARMNKITEDTEKVLQSMSWGPMQIMGTKLREYGYTGMLTEAIDPNISAHYSCKFLKQLLDKWVDVETAISAYNAGSPARDPVTKKFRNQEYVDKVINHYQGG